MYRNDLSVIIHLSQESDGESFVPRSKTKKRLLSVTDKGGTGNNSSDFSTVSRNQPPTHLPPLIDKDVTTDYTSDYSSVNNEFTYTYHELCPRDYYNSSFPSLMSHLGPTANHRTNRRKKASSMPSRNTVDAFTKLSEEHKKEVLIKKKQKENMTFTEKMKRFRENQWTRIETVAKEKLDHYDKYVSDMNSKLKKQRIQIEKRNEKQLQDLERLEIKKREDMLFHSPFGRMWRHHRTMQRRAYSLEPLHQPNVQVPLPSSRSTRSNKTMF